MSADFPLLSQINSPQDLRQLPETQLKRVAEEMRLFLVQTLDQCGGHFGASMGAVEITLALHYIFNTPHDRLVWDVGHQAYPHKILTQRRDQLISIRQTGGLAPFPSREESSYDCFGVGHSSTSISAALGMALAAKQLGINRKAVAIIGDGGLTGGMAFEALNHAGSVDANLLVILNDNEMSISQNVGALTNYLARILSGKAYSQLREGSKKVFSRLPSLMTLAKRTETHFKGIITPGTLFEELGFHYFGPLDGHDLPTLLSVLRNLHSQQGPQLLHIITQKGKGYPQAEAQPIEYHAVKTGFHSKPQIPAAPSTLTFSEVFGQWLCDMAKQDSKLVAITPAMCEGSGMVSFAQQFPSQYIDVGIAEQHSLTLAAGMACEGLKPVVAIYSTFLQRAYDQLIHDIALQNLPVTLAIDRGGLVGGDGATHNGQFDLSYLRCIPNLVLMAPADENECRQMLYTAYCHPGPAAVRYPRGQGSGVTLLPTLEAIPLGQAQVRRKGRDIAILVFGTLLETALTVGERLNATVVNMRFVKPLDRALIQTLSQTHQLIVTLEENAVLGGAGSGVNEVLAAIKSPVAVLNLGLPDRFIPHGDSQTLLKHCGLDADGIQTAITQRFILQENYDYTT
ncbi:MAG: 1-deoxy-D-xylulose-5-phosphate synthase [Gammaproteobacteria bacterium]